MVAISKYFLFKRICPTREVRDAISSIFGNFEAEGRPTDEMGSEGEWMCRRSLPDLE